MSSAENFSQSANFESVKDWVEFFTKNGKMLHWDLLMS